MNVYCIYDLLLDYPNPEATSMIPFFKKYKEYRRANPPSLKHLFSETSTAGMHGDLNALHKIIQSRIAKQRSFLPSGDEIITYAIPSAPWSNTLPQEVVTPSLEQEFTKSKFILNPKMAKNKSATKSKLAKEMTLNAMLRIVYAGWINISMTSCKSVLANTPQDYLMHCYKPGHTLYSTLSELEFSAYFPGLEVTTLTPIGKAAQFTAVFEKLSDDVDGLNYVSHFIARNVPEITNDLYSSLEHVTQLQDNKPTVTKFWMESKRRYTITNTMIATDFYDYYVSHLDRMLADVSILCVRGSKGLGKSRLAKILARNGILTIDSDDYGRVMDKGEGAEGALMAILLNRLNGVKMEETPTALEEIAKYVCEQVPLNSPNGFSKRCKLFSATVNTAVSDKKLMPIADFTKLVMRMLSKLPLNPSIRPQMVWFGHVVSEFHGVMDARIIEVSPVLDTRTVILSRDRNVDYLDAELFLHDMYQNSNTGMVLRFPFSVFVRVLRERCKDFGPS